MSMLSVGRETPSERIPTGAASIPPDMLEMLNTWLSMSVAMTRMLHESVRAQEDWIRSMTGVVELLQGRLNAIAGQAQQSQDQGRPAVIMSPSPANGPVGTDRPRAPTGSGARVAGNGAGAASAQGLNPAGPAPSDVPAPSGPGDLPALIGEAEPTGAIVGGIELVVGPFSRFSQLGDFLRALRALPGVESVMTRQFHRGILRLRVRYDNPIALATRLLDLSAFAPRIVSAGAARIELHVQCLLEDESSRAETAARASA
ncbi:MAG: hypothetical protein HY331_19080 [Chloroflexi bacterium]|nr:hypothetical protein [Chloroflexota bacterium]